MSVRYAVWLESPLGRGVLGDALPGGSDGELLAEFALGHNEVIAGWEQGVAGMRAGGVRWMVLPPHLAYGDEGREDAGIPGGAVLIFRVHVEEIREGQAPVAEALAIPSMDPESGLSIASAIQTLRPPSESGEDDDDWDDDPVGGAEVVVPSGDPAAEASDDLHAADAAAAHAPEEQASESGALGAEGEAALRAAHGDGEEGEEAMEAMDGSVRQRMAQIGHMIPGGPPGGMGMPAHVPMPHPVHAVHAHHEWGSGAETFVGYGGAGAGGAVFDALAAQRKGQEELVGAVREVRGGVEEVRVKVERLLDKADAKAAGGGADLLMGEVLVESIRKLVLDNDTLRSDAVRLREKVQEGSYAMQQLEEEKKHLETLLHTQTSQFVASSSAGESAEALKLQAARQQAELEVSNKEVLRAREEQAALQLRLDAALAEAREHKARSKAAQDTQGALQEQLEEAAAARDRAEAERKKLREDLRRERERWQEELEEERAGVDRNIKELRDSIRRLRVEGAGAAEAELDELQAKLQAQAAEREEELQTQLAAAIAAQRQAEDALGAARARAEEELAGAQERAGAALAAAVAQESVRVAQQVSASFVG